jgi:hypothetical protein
MLKNDAVGRDESAERHIGCIGLDDDIRAGPSTEVLMGYPVQQGRIKNCKPPDEVLLHVWRERYTLPTVEHAFLTAESLKEWSNWSHASGDVTETTEKRPIISATKIICAEHRAYGSLSCFDGSASKSDLY